MCLFIVCERVFTLGESRAISHANDMHWAASTTSSRNSRRRKIFHRNSSGERRLKFIESRQDDDNKNRELRENIAKHSEGNAGNVFNTATTNMYRGSDKILQLLCKRYRWREGTPTVDASKRDEEISQRLKFTVKIKFIFFDATIGSKSCTICTIYVKNIFPKDWGQPISVYTIRNNGSTVSFIMLQRTV